MQSFVLKTAGCIALAAGSALAQSTLEAPLGEIRSLVIDTGSLDNPTNAPAVVAAFPIEVEGSSWLRAYLEEASLPFGSTVRFTSMLDGDSQELDAKTLDMWSHTSAYLNGDTMLVELIAAPGTVGNRIKIKRVGLEIARPAGSAGQCGIVAGVDQRELSAEPWAGRIMPIGCTGSIYCNVAAGMVTAGHCINGQTGLVMHFNVPPSTSSCGTVAPAVADQFPILPGFQSVNGGVGNDWGVYTVGTNNLGQSPFIRYQAYRPVSPAVGIVGAPTNIWGYGVDDTCVRSQVQQSSPGSISLVDPTNYQFNNDIRGGNSGSGYINTDGTIIGIVTHCRFDGTANYAQRTDLPAFLSARNTMHPNCVEGATPFNDNCAAATPVAVGMTVGNTATATNDGSASCGNAASSNDVWYSFTPTCGGTYRIDTCGSAFDTVLSVHSVCGGSSILCNDDHAVGGPGGCANENDSAIVSTFNGGATYRIRVAGFGTQSGAFNLNVTAISTGAPNDACSNAITVGSGTFTGSTLCASNDGVACGTSSETPDVWFSYTAPCTGTAVFDTLGTPVGFDTVLSLHRACSRNTADMIVCHDDIGQGNLLSRITRTVTGGTAYLVRVSGHRGAAGVFTLNIDGPECAPACSWDIPGGCTADFDGDSDFDSDDITAYFGAWDSGDTCADADNDGDADSDDVQAFFAAWDAGSC